MKPLELRKQPAAPRRGEERVGLHRVEDDVIDVAAGRGGPIRAPRLVVPGGRAVDHDMGEIADADHRQEQDAEAGDRKAAAALERHEGQKQRHEQRRLEDRVAERLVADQRLAVERADLDRRVDMREQQEHAEAEQGRGEAPGGTFVQAREQPDHEQGGDQQGQPDRHQIDQHQRPEIPVVARMDVDAERDQREDDQEGRRRQSIVAQTRSPDPGGALRRRWRLLRRSHQRHPRWSGPAPAALRTLTASTRRARWPGRSPARSP